MGFTGGYQGIRSLHPGAFRTCLPTKPGVGYDLCGIRRCIIDANIFIHRIPAFHRTAMELCEAYFAGAIAFMHHAGGGSHGSIQIVVTADKPKYKIAAKADEQRLRDMKRLSGGAGGGDAAEAISERAVVPEFVPAEPLHLRSVLPPGYKDTYTDRRNSHFLLRLFREYVAAGHIAIRPGVTFIFDDGLGEPLHVTYERSTAGIPPGMSAALRDEACDLVKSVKSLSVESAYGEADLSLTFWVKYLADNYDIGDVLLETTDSDSLAIFTLFMAKEYMADDIGEEPGTTISTPMFDVWLHSAPISKKTMDGGREMIPQFLNLTQVMREGAAAGRPLRIQAFLYMAGGNDYVVRRYGLGLEQLLNAWDASDHSADFLPVSIEQLRTTGWVAWAKFLFGIDKVAAKAGRVGEMIPQAIEMYTFYTQVAWCYFYQGDVMQADVLEETEVEGRLYREWPWRKDDEGRVTREGACVVPHDLRDRVDAKGASLHKRGAEAKADGGAPKKRRVRH